MDLVFKKEFRNFMMENCWNADVNGIDLSNEVFIVSNKRNTILIGKFFRLFLFGVADSNNINFFRNLTIDLEVFRSKILIR